MSADPFRTVRSDTSLASVSHFSSRFSLGVAESGNQPIKVSGHQRDRELCRDPVDAYLPRGRNHSEHEALNAASRAAALDGGHAELFAIMENPGLVASMVKTVALTPEEQISLSAYLFAVMRVREFAWGQYQDGVIDDAQWATEVNVIRFVFDSERNRQWWERMGRAAFSAEFSDFVESVISDSTPTNSLWPAYTEWASATNRDSGTNAR